MTGIVKTLQVFEAMDALLVDVIGVVKAGGFRLGILPKVIDAVQEIGVLTTSVAGALPELMELDAQESAQLGAAAYKLVKDIMMALA